MIADPEGPSFIVRTVGHRRYSDGAFVTHDPRADLSPIRSRSGLSQSRFRAPRRRLDFFGVMSRSNTKDLQVSCWPLHTPFFTASSLRRFIRQMGAPVLLHFEGVLSKLFP